MVKLARILAALTLVSLLLLSLACGDDDDTGSDADNGDDALAATETSSATEATRSFVDVRGKAIDVPNEPQRIVAIHDINAGAHLLSLGAPVVGMSQRDSGVREDISRYFDLDGIASVGVTYEPDIEAIAALNPDLIVGEGFNGQGMDQFMNDGVQAQLETIAPVVYIDTFRPVEEVMADFAELIGADAQERFQQQQTEFDGVIEEIRAILGDRWGSTTVSNVDTSTEGGLQIWGPTALAPTDILTRVGAQWPDLMLEAGEPENGGYIGGVSLERIGDLEADIILVTTAHGAGVLGNALYQQMSAVKAGQVIDLSEPTAGSHYANYLYVARFLLNQLTAMEPIDTDIVVE
jgi:iron complex transport system substrate-binding protein